MQGSGQTIEMANDMLFPESGPCSECGGDSWTEVMAVSEFDNRRAQVCNDCGHGRLVPHPLSMSQMIDKILASVPHSEVVIGKGAASVLVYPPPRRNEERLWTVTGDDPLACIVSLHAKLKERRNATD